MAARAGARAIQPAQGWPLAPCPKWQTEHPAHGWIGRKSGRLYWCCQAIREAAQALTDPAARATVRAEQGTTDQPEE